MREAQSTDAAHCNSQPGSQPVSSCLLLLPCCRTKLGDVMPDIKDPDTGKPQDPELGSSKGRDTLMGAVLTVTVAIVAVCVLRRPQVLGSLLRKLFARA